MKVSLDGARTWIDAPEGVRVFVETIVIYDEECDGHDGGLCFNLTDEGLVIDAHCDFFDDAAPEEAISVASWSLDFDAILMEMGLS